jgi:hypothetical protein
MHQSIRSVYPGHRGHLTICLTGLKELKSNVCRLISIKNPKTVVKYWGCNFRLPTFFNPFVDANVISLIPFWELLKLANYKTTLKPAKKYTALISFLMFS